MYSNSFQVLIGRDISSRVSVYMVTENRKKESKTWKDLR